MESSFTDITEFLRIQQKLSRKTARRQLFFLSVIALAFFLSGVLMHSAQTQSSQDPLSGTKILLSGFIIMSFVPLGYFLVWASEKFTNWPRCPKCKAALTQYAPAMRHCPNCRQIIFADSRPLKAGYCLPSSEEIAQIQKDQKELTFSKILLTFTVLFIICGLGALLWVDIDFFLYYTISLSIELIGIALYNQQKLVQLLKRIDNYFPKINRLLNSHFSNAPPPPERCCPHCGKEPDHRVAAITGNCSLCGGAICTPQEEPETSEMMNSILLHRYLTIEFYYRGILLLFFLLPFGWLIIILLLTITNRYDTLPTWLDELSFIFTLFVVISGAILLMILKRKWHIQLKCPHCKARRQMIERFLLTYGHCPNCLKKLVKN